MSSAWPTSPSSLPQLLLWLALLSTATSHATTQEASSSTSAASTTASHTAGSQGSLAFDASLPGSQDHPVNWYTSTLGADVYPSSPASPPGPAPTCSAQTLVYIGVPQLVAACLVILINAGLSLYFRLGLHWQITIAAGRCVLQLTVLGYLLVPVLSYGAIWLVLLFGGAMMCVSAMEAVSRPAWTYKGMLRDTAASVASGATPMIALTLLAVVPVRPALEARYVVPLLGMLLGNSIGGLAVGLAAILEELHSGREQLEMLLAMGASRSEASRPMVQRALSLSLSPLLSQMSVVGLVSIPGMMSGALLAGIDPVQASRYQLAIMFLIAGSTAISSLASILLAVHRLVDAQHMLCFDQLQPRYHASGLLTYLKSRFTEALSVLHHFSQRFYVSCCSSRRRRAPRSASEFRRQLYAEGSGAGGRPSPRPSTSLPPSNHSATAAASHSLAVPRDRSLGPAPHTPSLSPRHNSGGYSYIVSPGSTAVYSQASFDEGRSGPLSNNELDYDEEYEEYEEGDNLTGLAVVGHLAADRASPSSGNSRQLQPGEAASIASGAAGGVRFSRVSSGSRQEQQQQQQPGSGGTWMGLLQPRVSISIQQLQTTHLPLQQQQQQQTWGGMMWRFVRPLTGAGALRTAAATPQPTPDPVPGDGV
ncbi:MAG: hypothetical protein WDW36_000493 [Sanguina aurantia]